LTSTRLADKNEFWLKEITLGFALNKEGNVVSIMSTEKNGSWDFELSIIIPVKDEEENIAGLAKEVNESMASVDYLWECIWVDDGSTDGTLSGINRIPVINLFCCQKTTDSPQPSMLGLISPKGGCFQHWMGTDKMIPRICQR